jgi:hypothetical protein
MHELCGCGGGCVIEYHSVLICHRSPARSNEFVAAQVDSKWKLSGWSNSSEEVGRM